jgi:hypothetical protein
MHKDQHSRRVGAAVRLALALARTALSDVREAMIAGMDLPSESSLEKTLKSTSTQYFASCIECSEDEVCDGYDWHDLLRPAEIWQIQNPE